LKAEPPQPSTRMHRIAYRADILKSLPFSPIGESHPAIKFLVKVLKDRRLNMVLEPMQAQALKRLVAISLQPWVELAEAMRLDPESAKALGRLPEAQQSIILQG